MENIVDGSINCGLVRYCIYVFHTMALFDSRKELINWMRETVLPLGIVLVVSSSHIARESFWHANEVESTVNF